MNLKLVIVYSINLVEGEDLKKKINVIKSPIKYFIIINLNNCYHLPMSMYLMVYNNFLKLIVINKMHEMIKMVMEI